ncbi:SHOCT domain-containing protein [Alkalibaculum bacchi]|uniref:SHOCT domain-containing protein n=1 Tax=Alkalibaculum bacchi TaxID=645887 RepID=UPI0026F316F3|nr:SHOCT domain-containing protein [Alkalibaculum bacchi]
MKVTDTIPEIIIEKKNISHDQLQREFDYMWAQRVLENLVQKGLISELEFNKITKLNRQSFTPALAQIMPENRCY